MALHGLSVADGDGITLVFGGGAAAGAYDGMTTGRDVEAGRQEDHAISPVLLRKEADGSRLYS